MFLYTDSKTSVCNAGDLGSIPGLRRSPGEEKGYPLQYTGLKTSMDYSAWGHKESDMNERLSLSLTYMMKYNEIDTLKESEIHILCVNLLFLFLK